MLLQELQDDLQEILQLRRRTAEYQLACYPANGSQYVKHRDALPDDGSDPMQRKVAPLPCSPSDSSPCNHISWLLSLSFTLATNSAVVMLLSAPILCKGRHDTEQRTASYCGRFGEIWKEGQQPPTSSQGVHVIFW